jgi:hypothetical protein
MVRAELPPLLTRQAQGLLPAPQMPCGPGGSSRVGGGEAAAVMLGLCDYLVSIIVTIAQVVNALNGIGDWASGGRRRARPPDAQSLVTSHHFPSLTFPLPVYNWRLLRS